MPPPLLLLPLTDWATRPSLGCTSTQPSPWKATCTDSPEPIPMKLLRLASGLIEGGPPLDQTIAPRGAHEVGAPPVSSSRGGPSDTTATVPVPLSFTLKMPPVRTP